MAQSIIINKVTYNNVPQVSIPLSSGDGNATFWDTTIADVVASQILAGKKAFGPDGEVTGSMADNGDTSGTISTKAGTVTIPAGYTSGGTVEIADDEQAKIIPANILAGATILGVSGSPSNVDTADANASANNIFEGYTAYVNGSKVTGTLTCAVVTQDAETNVLSIS